MASMRAALIAAGLPANRPIPSRTWDCLKPRRPRRGRGARGYTDTHKWCPRCGQWLEHRLFNRDRRSASGLTTYCKSCRSDLWHEQKRRMPRQAARV